MSTAIDGELEHQTFANWNLMFGASPRVAKLRKEAIALAGVRVGAASSYRIHPHEVSQLETFGLLEVRIMAVTENGADPNVYYPPVFGEYPPVYPDEVLVVPVGAPGGAEVEPVVAAFPETVDETQVVFRERATADDEFGEWFDPEEIDQLGGDNAPRISRERYFITAFAPLNPDEEDLMFFCMRLAMGVTPIAGVVLRETGHHIINPKKSQFMGVVKQLTNEATPVFREAWNVTQVDMLPLVLHDAVHPISMDLLRGLAIDITLKARLEAAGLGSAAIRVPYKEDLVRAANAYVAIIEAIGYWTIQSGYRIETPTLGRMVAFVESLPFDAEFPGRGAPNDIGVFTTREQALMVGLSPLLVLNRSHVAVAAGIYFAILEDTGGDPRVDTLLTAHSLSKLVTSNKGAFATGVAAYNNFKRVGRAAADRGEYRTTLLTDADYGV